MDPKALIDPDELLTTGVVAAWTRVSQQSVIRACDSGILKSCRVMGSKHRRIRRADAEAFAAANGLPWAKPMGVES
jgi:hypothetical protein